MMESYLEKTAFPYLITSVLIVSFENWFFHGKTMKFNLPEFLNLNKYTETNLLLMNIFCTAAIVILKVTIYRVW